VGPERFANERRSVETALACGPISRPQQLLLDHDLNGFHTVDDIPQSYPQSIEPTTVADARSGVPRLEEPTRPIALRAVSALGLANLRSEPLVQLRQLTRESHDRHARHLLIVHGIE
jgi:hypothetical protein